MRTNLTRNPATVQGAFAPFVMLGPASVVDSFRTLMGNASLLLLVGGLAILILIVVLVILQALVPGRRKPSDEEHETRRPQLRPLAVPENVNPDVYAEGIGTRRVPIKPTVDRAMDRVAELHLGEPRILRHRPRFTHVRLYSCRTCEPQTEPTLQARVSGCASEQSGIQEAFQAVFGSSTLVRESSCRLRGQFACEFEVRH